MGLRAGHLHGQEYEDYDEFVEFVIEDVSSLDKSE